MPKIIQKMTELTIQIKSTVPYNDINTDQSYNREVLLMRYGYFDNDNKEYVIEKVDLPTSWTNYLGVEDTCVVVNHTAERTTG